LILSKFWLWSTNVSCACVGLLGFAVLSAAGAQVPSVPNPTSPTPSSYQGSVPTGEATTQTIELSLDDAVQRGLKANLGIILSGTQTASVRGEKLTELQSLLPSVDFKGTESVQQVDLAAQGLRIPGFPTIIGPFGYTDLRAYLSWSILNMNSLRNYLAAKHNLNAATLSAQDAQDLVVLTVGNAYLLVLADESQVTSVEAQVATAKVSLDQAVARHSAGTAPRLDELRARVDYQRLQQLLIVAKNSLEKDKLALARTIGLPLAQSFTLRDKVPFKEFDQIDVNAAIQQAHANRKDLAAMVEQAKAAEEQRKAATAERYPVLTASGDYGVIGPNLGTSHGTGDATGAMKVPLFKEFVLRGDAEIAQSQLDLANAQLSDKGAQVDADVRDALLDIQSAQQEVEVSRSSVELANQTLSDAQERYSNGVSDNLPVSEAQQTVARANDQYVASLYKHNVAKLSLARALGAGSSYKSYLGGK